jgi:DNA gyrase subunit B
MAGHTARECEETEAAATPTKTTERAKMRMASFMVGNPGGNNGSYTGENITVLEGMEHVRLRPAMYIGSTGEMGLHHLVYEVVDNSVDEALAGYATKIDVIIHVDNSITVTTTAAAFPST